MTAGHKRKSLLHILAVLLLIAGLGAFLAGPMIYNHYIFPLGKLHHKISIGEDYASVQGKFQEYVKKRKGGSKELQFSEGPTSLNIRTGPIAETEQLFLYDVSAFDDVQLQVLFDDMGHAKEINFIGD